MNDGTFKFSGAVARWQSLSLLLAFLVPCAPLFAAAPVPAGTSVSNLEEGKALFESGRYQDAISKFIMVLRSDPQNPEARQYLRQSVDQMRQNPAAQRGPVGSTPSTARVEMREMLQKRAALTLDLMAIPGVDVTTQNAVTRVEIASSLVFPSDKGGLMEEGIPILDRVSAWLKTFGQQPILIHCYPEETQDVAATGSLFLRRYSELYNFFTEERKLSPQRLISADLLADQAASGKSSTKDAAPVPNVDTTKHRILIETLGSQSAFLEGAMPSSSPKTAIARWLEFAVISHRDIFNPEEGEWATLDLAALSRTGLRNWSFDIMNDADKSAVYHLEGTGNVLKRLIWDGRNTKTGSLVQGGSYTARISATNTEGTIKSEQVVVRVERTTADEPIVVGDVKPVAAKPTVKKAKRKKKKAAASVPALVVPVTPAATATPPAPDASSDAMPTLPEPPVAADPSEVSPATPETAEPAEDSSHAIFKQVIQFDKGVGELSPSVGTSLEQIGKTLDVYPLQKVRIIGFASTAEANAAVLAKKRADDVRSALEEQYHVDGKRILMGGTRVKAGSTMSKVELSITN
jgi:outer membrane protein OmpA-like peptidoglycan-associated protein